MAGRVPFLARPYVFCVVFLYSRTVKEARLRFFFFLRENAETFPY